MAKVKNKRWRLFADPSLQGQLMVRVAGYWFLCMAGQLLTLAAFSALANGEAAPTAFVTQMVVVSLILLPVALYDAIAFSNRFAGPMINLRRRVNQLADGQTLQPMTFRPGDFFRDIEEPFNQVQKQCAADETRPTESTTVTEREHAAVLIGAEHV